MLGYIRQEATNRRTQLIREDIAGIPFLTLYCGDRITSWRRRRLLRVLHRMTQMGVRQAVVPKPLMALCSEAGIDPISESPLRQALLEPILDCFCRQNKLDIHRSTVRLCASRTDRGVQQAAELLARKARYVMLDTGRGQEELSDRLRRKYGLSTGDSGRGAIMQICCDEAKTLEMPTLWLGEQCERHQCVHYQLRKPWKGKIDEDPQLLCALFKEGKLPDEAIRIESVESYA